MKLKLLIHGRKFGYQILYPKPTPQEFYAFASDIQSISAPHKRQYYGKTFYTLAQAEKGTIYTEYIFGYDVDRGYLGEIAMSVYIPDTYKLEGKDIKALLDDLINIYADNYIEENRIVAPRKGFDWNLFENKLKEYESKLKPRISKFPKIASGTKAPAYHYYQGEEELLELLDNPFQTEYKEYRQVYFIDKKLRNTEADILEAITHTDEITPDLEDEYYFLEEKPTRPNEISVKVNGTELTTSKGRDYIRSKSQTLYISYNKDERCYEPWSISGKLSEGRLDKYIKLDEESNTIAIKYDEIEKINPTPKEKEFDINPTSSNGRPIEDCKITTIIPEPKAYKKRDSRITFTGEELIKSYEIVVENKNFCSKTVRFTPNDYNDKELKITLLENVELEITVKDPEGNKIEEYEKIKIVNNKGKKSKTLSNNKINRIIFKGDELDETWTITFKNDKYKGQRTYNYNSSKSKKITIECTYKEYIIEDGEHGKYEGKKKVDSVEYFDRRNVKSDEGYEFDKTKIEGHKIIIQYKEKRKLSSSSSNDKETEQSKLEKTTEIITETIKNPKVIALMFVLLLLGGVVTYLSIFEGNNEKKTAETLTPPDNSVYTEINTLHNKIVINANIYNPDSTELAYDNTTNVNLQTKLGPKPGIEKRRKWTTLWVTAEKDSTNYKKWEKYSDKLKAIEQRLREKSEQLSNLDNNSAQEGSVNTAGTNSQKPNKQENSRTSTSNKATAKGESSQASSTSSRQSSINFKEELVIKDLKNKVLDTSLLNNLKAEFNSNKEVIKAIDLQIKYWKLDSKQKGTYSSLWNEVRSNNILKKSKLERVLKEINSKSQEEQGKFKYTTEEKLNFIGNFKK